METTEKTSELAIFTFIDIISRVQGWHWTDLANCTMSTNYKYFNIQHSIQLDHELDPRCCNQTVFWRELWGIKNSGKGHNVWLDLMTGWWLWAPCFRISEKPLFFILILILPARNSAFVNLLQADWNFCIAHFTSNWATCSSISSSHHRASVVECKNCASW